MIIAVSDSGSTQGIKALLSYFSLGCNKNGLIKRRKAAVTTPGKKLFGARISGGSRKYFRRRGGKEFFSSIFFLETKILLNWNLI